MSSILIKIKVLAHSELYEKFGLVLGQECFWHVSVTRIFVRSTIRDATIQRMNLMNT